MRKNSLCSRRLIALFMAGFVMFQNAVPAYAADMENLVTDSSEEASVDEEDQSDIAASIASSEDEDEEEKDDSESPSAPGDNENENTHEDVPPSQEPEDETADEPAEEASDEASLDASDESTEESSASESSEILEEVEEKGLKGTITGGSIGKTDEDTVTWSYDDETYTFTLAGAGDMKDYSSDSTREYYSCRSSAKTIVIGKDVTSLGENSFAWFQQVTAVEFEEGSALTSIAKRSFYYCSNIQSMNIPDGVTAIGNEAFDNCTKMSELHLSTSLESIGSSAFNNCDKLENISIPAGCITLGNSFLHDCDALITVELPATLTVIPESAFSGCDKLETVNLPDSLTTINHNAFDGCYKLSSANIPNTVTTIDYDAFKNCDSITTVTIPAGVQKIGGSAFNSCDTLASLTITSGVETIDNNAFANCIALTSVTIPESVTTINYSAFYGCTNLASVRFPEGYSNNIKSGMFQKCSKLTAFTIPAGVTGIDNNAFNESGITSISIPASVKTISSQVFKDCASLTSVTFANESLLTSISSYAFERCKITEITIPKSVTSIDKNTFNETTSLEKIYIEEGNSQYYSDDDGLVYLKSNDLLYLTPPGFKGTVRPKAGITELTANYYSYKTDVTIAYVPYTVVTIRSDAFRGCTNLESVVFETGPNGEASRLTTVEGSAFRDCYALDNLVLPSTVTSLGSSVFEQCRSLTSSPIDNTSITKLPQWAFYNCYSLTEITIPTAVTQIDANAFQLCKALTSITIPSGVTRINTSTFEECTNLETVNIPATVTEIYSSAFKKCKALSALPLTANITKVDSNAFEECTAFKAITIPSTVTSWGQGVFKKCTSVTSVTFADGFAYTSIPNYFFEECTSLKNITIPNSVTTIGNGTFRNCSALEAITLPSGLTKLDYNAFENCNSLTELTIPDSLVDFYTSSFSNCQSLASVSYVTDGKDGGNATYYSKGGIIYKRADDSVYFRPRANTDLSGITILTRDYFKNNTKLTSIVIPKNITTIDYEAFYGCTNLETVTFEAGSQLTAINNYAFYNCASLKGFTIPATVTSIGNYAFCRCASLTAITIPESVTSIGTSAFEDCTSLASVKFSGTCAITRLESYIFESTALVSFDLPASVTYFSTNIFADCQKLKTVNVASGNPTYYSENGVVYKKADQSLYFKPAANTTDTTVITEYTASDYAQEKNKAVVTIPKTVTKISANAFKNAYTLTTVKFASGSKLKTVDNRAFYGCTKLKSITLPGGVTSIGEEAFYNCYSLTAFTLPASLETIGAEAFQNCSKLGSVKFPAKLTTIGARAYDECKALKTVTIPVTVTSIGEAAFSDCDGLTTATINVNVTGKSMFEYCNKLATVNCNANTITQQTFYYCEALKTVKLKNTVTIGKQAFYGCSALTSLVLPDTTTTIEDNGLSGLYVTTLSLGKGLQTIGSYGLSGCSKLTKLDIPASVTSIETYAFSGCSKLEKIAIPEGITEIKAYLFNNCSGLKRIEIPASVTTINVSAFTGCTALEEIVIAEGNENYVVNDGVVYTIDAEGKKTFFYCPLAWNEADKLIVPENTTSIPSGAFQNNETIVSITIPASVTTIGNNAFNNCKRLRYVYVEEGSALTSIGERAFYNCSDLNHITFNGDTALESIGSQAFYYCSDLTGIYFDNNTKDISIGNNAFNGDRHFKGFYNGSNAAPLSYIGEDAFWNCSALEFIKLGQSVSYISKIYYSSYNYSPFFGCTSLKAFEMDAPNDYCYVDDGVLFLKSYTTNITSAGRSFTLNNVLFCYPLGKEDFSYTVPDGTEAIGECAFRFNSALEEVVFADSVVVIDDYAFDECKKLTTISNLKMSYINIYAFSDCANLEEADLSQTTESIIQADVFFRCNNLKKVILPDTIRQIGNRAFYYCYNLVNMNLPDEVYSIGEQAFFDCYRWADISIPSALTELGVSAYYDCDSLEEVVIPAGLTIINDKTFSNCNGIKKITFDYENSQLTSIGSWAFSSAYYLESVKLPEGITSLSGGIFSDCSRLHELEIPSTVTEMKTNCILTEDSKYAYGNYAIQGSYIVARCNNLSRIVIKNPSLVIPKYIYFSNGNSPVIYIYSTPTVTGDDGEVDSAVKSYCDNYKNGSEKAYQPYFVNISDYDNPANDPYISGSQEIPDTRPVTGKFRSEYWDLDNQRVFSVFEWTYNKDTKTLTVEGNGLLDVDNLYEEEEEDEEDDDDDGNLILSGEEEFVNVTWHSYYEDDVEHVVLEDTITGLGPNTFYDHQALKSIQYNVFTTIGAESFYNCKSLESFTFKPGLTYIGYEAFDNCDSLEEVILPDGLENMGSWTFEYCDSLKKVVIPGSLKNVAYCAFAGCYALNDLTLEEGIESTNYSFNYCSSLTTINLPASMEEFVEDFTGMTSLETITVAEGSEYYKVVDGCLFRKVDDEWVYVWGRMEAEIGGEKVLFINKSMTNIQLSTLANNKSYKRVVVEDGNTTFKTIRDMLYSIDGRTLYLVPGLYEGEVVIEPGTRTISAYALAYCSRITGVSIPESVSVIGANAFSYSNIRGIVTIPEGVTKIEGYTFSYCRKLSSVVFPSSLTSIGYNAFYYCQSLKEIFIPDSVTSIGNNAFYQCSSLKTVLIPGGIGTVPYNCFGYCTSLDDVRLCEGITILSDYAFQHCTSLTQILLPEGLKRLEGQTFYYCTSLEDITIPGSVEFIYLNPSWYKVPKTYGGYTYYNMQNSFYCCNRYLTIYGEPGSYAQQYAEGGFTIYNTSSGNYVITGIEFAQRRSDKYYITYKLDTNAGEYNHPDNPTSYRNIDQRILLYPAEKAGYTFDGWYTDITLTNRIEYVVASFEARQLVLYPRWLLDHHVTITGEGLDESRVVTIPETRSFISEGIEPVEREGKQFAGYVNADGSAFDVSAPVYEDITISAVYAEADELVVMAPTAGVKSGEVTIGTPIALLTETEDAAIYYTLGDASPVNGTALSDEAALYEDRIVLTQDKFNAGGICLLHAVAVKDNTISKVAEYRYTIADTTSKWGEILADDRGKYGSADEVPDEIWVAGVPESAVYTGKKITFDFRVYYGKKLLTEKTDYTVTYKNNINAYTFAEGDEGFVAGKAPSITVKGKGNYRDSRVIYFIIKPANISSSVIQTKVSMRTSYFPSYDGYRYTDAPEYNSYYTLFDRVTASKKAQKLAPVVTFAGNKLKAGKDYDIVYSEGNDNYINPGCYYMALKGKNNFTSELWAGYVIADSTVIPANKVKIEGFKSSLPYNNGQAVTQSIMLTYKAGKKVTTLSSSDDYSIAYENNTQIGKATMTIRFFGDYTGTVVKTFNITGVSIKKAKKIKNWQAVMYYDGKPKYQGNVELEIPATKKTAAVELTKGTDYVMSYSPNVKVGKVTVTFTGTGMYTGTMKKTFSIKALETKNDQVLKRPNIVLSVNDAPYAKGGVKPVVTVRYKGLDLTAGKDYTIRYKNNKNVYTLTDGEDGFNLKKAPTVTIKMKGNFKGSISGTFRITKQNLSLLSLSAADVAFADKPGNYKSGITIKDLDGKALKAGSDYDKTLVYTYAEASGGRRAGSEIGETDTVPVGTVVRVTARGTENGAYSGSISATYRVAAALISKATVSVSKEAVFVYSGYGLVPRKSDLTVSINGTELRPSEYEIVSCVNNVKTGKATLVLKGLGPNYGGTKSVTFSITQMSLKPVTAGIGD